MKKRIMIVDDSATIRLVVVFTLEAAGFEVIEAADGEEALAKLSEGPLDMLISDLNMPKLDGIELTRAVRKNPEHRFMPILMLTTESQTAKKQQGKEAGASAWLVKPFKPEQLLSVINLVLS